MCLTITEGVRVRAWFVVMLVFVLCRKKIQIYSRVSNQSREMISCLKLRADLKFHFKIVDAFKAFLVLWRVIQNPLK